MKFKDGELFDAIYFEDDQAIKTGVDCDSIILSMENGQMGGAPWFEVWKDGEIISKWNAAKCEGISYAHTKEKE